MYLADIQNAVMTTPAHDTLRAAFRAIAADEDRILAPDGLQISDSRKRGVLRAACELLKFDDTAMPHRVCEKLRLSAGSSYAEGATKALEIWGETGN